MLLKLFMCLAEMMLTCLSARTEVFIVQCFCSKKVGVSALSLGSWVALFGFFSFVEAEFSLLSNKY